MTKGKGRRTAIAQVAVHLELLLRCFESRRAGIFPFRLEWPRSRSYSAGTAAWRSHADLDRQRAQFSMGPKEYQPDSDKLAELLNCQSGIRYLPA